LNLIIFKSTIEEDEAEIVHAAGAEQPECGGGGSPAAAEYAETIINIINEGWVGR
jgi:hypothetical protein